MNLKGRWIAVALMLAVGIMALSACAPVQPEGAADDTGAAATDGPQAESVTEVTGTITAPEGEAIPADARVVVDLLDLTAWTPVATVTYTTTADGFPLSFALTSSDLAESGPYGVSARVIVEGRPRYLVMEPATVQFGASTQLELALVSNAEMLAPEVGAVSGTLNKMDRSALPNGTVVVVDLLDLTTWTPVATDTYETTGEQTPLPFAIETPADAVSAEGLYGLAARLLIDGRPMYVTMEVTPIQSGDPTEGFELMLTDNSEMLAPEEPAAESDVTGAVTYRQRIALPEGAVITVRLQDVSRQDVAATLISEQVITTAGEQVPVSFTLPYDPVQIDDRFTYSVSARIEIDGKLAWISDTMTPVITRGAPTSDVQIMLVQVN